MTGHVTEGLTDCERKGGNMLCIMGIGGVTSNKTVPDLTSTIDTDVYWPLLGRLVLRLIRPEKV